MNRGPLSWLPHPLLSLGKEVLRHLLRRPVVGVVAVACREGGDVLLVRRADTGTWALPGGTLEWNETLSRAIERELVEEAGTRLIELGPLWGVYSRPDRDPRFHAVTVVVGALVTEHAMGPTNRLEIREARFFSRAELPTNMAMGTQEMLANALAGRVTFE